jgi:PKD repeat protein
MQKSLFKKGLAIGIFVLLFGTSFIPSISGDTNTIRNKKSSLEVIKIFGLFPKVIGDIIIYLSLNPFGWKTIYKDHFKGSFGLTIVGSYNTSIPPQADFIYFPSKDVLRVKGNPFFFKSLSTDLDGEIIEEWWKFNDLEPWVMTNDPNYIFSEPGYYNVSLRVIDNDGFNNTYTKRIRIYERTPTYQGIQGSNYVTIVGLHVVGSTKYYNWSDFRNVGSGSCVLPSSGHPEIGDVITDCYGAVILQYIPNGVISGSWYF